MKSIYKKILSIGLIGALLELMPVYQAHAAGAISSALSGLFSITGVTSGVVTFVSQTVLGLFTYIAQVAFIMVGFFVELAMKLNNNILDPDQNKFVFTGWTVFVNVADLALVVALIIIAFATMLNFQSYGMKKTLVPLIVVALLINFSLVIPGVLIDMAGMVTDFFVQQAGLTGSGMSSALATAFNISGFMSTASKDAAASGANLAGVVAGQLGSGIMNIIMNMVFIVAFTMVAAVIMATLAIMLFIRYFMLSFLLLMSPLIAVSRIFPSTKSHWDDWWNKFVRWTMFPPVMVFFMWLSLTALNAPSNIESPPATGSAWDTVKALMNFNLSALIHMAMAVMLMILSLIAANSISIKGAKGSKDMVATMTGWGRGKIEGWGKGAQAQGRAAGAYARREGERQGRRFAAPVAATIGRRSEAMRKYEGEKGGVRGYVAGAIGRAGEKVTAKQQAALKKTYEDKFKGMSEDNLAMRYSTMGNDEKVFAAQQLAAKGKLNKVNEKLLDRDIAEGKDRFETYGGEGTYGKVTKAAGRNAEMISGKKKMEDVANMPAGVAKTDATYKAKKEYKDAAKAFYDGFSRKDFETLGSKFYGDGKYGNEALERLLAKEPSAFSKIISGLDKSADVQQFNDKAIKVIESMKSEALKVIKEAPNAPVESETNKELLSVMKGLKDFNEKDAREMNLLQKMKWVEEKDARVHAALGGEKLATDFEQQVKFLVETRKNQNIMSVDGVQDYQKTIRTQSAMRKSMGNRIYAESKKEEEKKAA